MLVGLSACVGSVLREGFGPPPAAHAGGITDARIERILADIGSASDEELAAIIAQSELHTLRVTLQPTEVQILGRG